MVKLELNEAETLVDTGDLGAIEQAVAWVLRMLLDRDFRGARVVIQIKRIR